ncbi:hypothetical protein D3C75_629940 [compost metagenome]
MIKVAPLSVGELIMSSDSQRTICNLNILNSGVAPFLPSGISEALHNISGKNLRNLFTAAAGDPG